MQLSTLVLSLVLLCCCTLVSCNDYNVKSPHRNMQENNFIDFDGNDLMGDDAASKVVDQFSSGLEKRISQVFERAKTPECRKMIAEHFGYFVNAVAKETSFPFHEAQFLNDCPEEVYVDFDDLPEGMHIGMIQNRTYQPEDGEYIDDPKNLKLLYAILTHQNPAETKRLVESLYEPGYTFVIHVDGKSEDTYKELVAYAKDKAHVHVLPDPYRCRVNWGGFSMVNATMQVLYYSFGRTALSKTPLDFHKFVHISSSSYPIASNTKIRQTLASYPLDANMMNVIMRPTRPNPAAWQYFVECDDWVHRIHRLHPLSEGNGGIELFTSSQWFILSREFAHYLAKAEPGTLVYDMLEYAEHVVVADEAFFGTVLRNSQFCTKHHNTNFLHLQFDRYENDLDESQRDERKCIMTDRNHCGRSPTTMTADYAAVLELTGDLFARKFVDPASSSIKDYIDALRQRQELELTGQATFEPTVHTTFQGHGVLIVAKDTVHDAMPLCLGIGASGNKGRLLPCFHDWVPLTLAEDWETGAVIAEEVIDHNRWEIGPCSADGELSRSMETAEMKMVPGNFSDSGPKCMLTQMDGLRVGRCLDAESGLQPTPGGTSQVYPCAKRWHQFFSFGNGGAAPTNSIYTSIPRHIVQQLRNTKGFPDQERHICLGVRGRGDQDEEGWVKDVSLEDGEDLIPDNLEGDEVEAPLHKWIGMQVVSTQCSNKDAVVEWIYVPFIVESQEKSEESEDDVSSKEEL